MKTLFNSFVGRPWLLFAALVFGNAVMMPYSGIRHDARLYAAQCLQAYDGRFANDLFFAYGSQAKFSLFPQLLGAVVGNLGVEGPFFVLYLVSTWLLLFAVMRLFLQVFGDNPWTVASLLIFAVQPVPVGGLGIFFLQETFLTARIPAAALTLLAMERMIAGRWTQSIGLLFGALVLHPLVATAGAVLFALHMTAMAYKLLPRLTVGALVAAVVAGMVLIATVGPTRCFGHYDPEWRSCVDRLLRFPDPREWGQADVVRLGLGFAAAFFATRITTLEKSSREFLVFVILTALLGLIVAVIAGPLEWALLFQGQAFRWVWLLELLRIPCCLFVAKFLLERKLRGDGITVALFVLAALGFPFSERYALLPLAALAIATRLTSRSVDGERVGFRRLLIWGGLLFLLLDFRQLWQAWEWKQTFGWDRAYDFAERGHAWACQLRSVPKLLLLIGLLRLISTSRAAAVGLLVASLCAQAGWFQICRSDWAAANFDTSLQDREFVREYLSKRADGPRPMLYQPGSRPEANWMILNCPMYFDPMQLGGQAFHRGTAMEGRRRALLTRPYEVEMIRESKDPAWTAELTRSAEDNVYETNLDHPPPTIDDFRRLLDDPLSEVVVLPREYPGWSATNGRVFVYEAARLRCRK